MPYCLVDSVAVELRKLLSCERRISSLKQNVGYYVSFDVEVSSLPIDQTNQRERLEDFRERFLMVAAAITRVLEGDANETTS